MGSASLTLTLTLVLTLTLTLTPTLTLIPTLTRTLLRAQPRRARLAAELCGHLEHRGRHATVGTQQHE